MENGLANDPLIIFPFVSRDLFSLFSLSLFDSLVVFFYFQRNLQADGQQHSSADGKPPYAPRQ